MSSLLYSENNLLKSINQASTKSDPITRQRSTIYTFNHQLHFEKVVLGTHPGMGILVPASQLLNTNPVQNCGSQHSSLVTLVPQIIPPCLLHTFLHELGHSSLLILSLLPQQLTPPYQVSLQPPEQHDGKVVPQTTPPRRRQHSTLMFLWRRCSTDSWLWVLGVEANSSGRTNNSSKKVGLKLGILCLCTFIKLFEGFKQRFFSGGREPEVIMTRLKKENIWVCIKCRKFNQSQKYFSKELPFFKFGLFKKHIEQIASENSYQIVKTSFPTRFFLFLSIQRNDVKLLRQMKECSIELISA